jgi:hypothetical protein
MQMDEALIAEADAEAKRRNISRTALVVIALRALLDGELRPRPQPRLGPSDIARATAMARQEALNKGKYGGKR